MSIADNLADVRARISAACARCGRDPSAVRLMAVSKTFPAEVIREAYAAGQRLFGENRVQEWADKRAALADLAELEMHLIGHLQSNKTGKAAQIFDAVDSVDSLKLLDRLNDASKNERLNDATKKKTSGKLRVLIEINVGGEEAKSGVAPDSEELEQMLSGAAQLLNVEIRGLMTIPPFTDDPEGARPYFHKLRELREAIARRKLPRVGMDELSMGMSHDFEVAIEEGSTCVRVGTAIFGEREKKA
jgi:pyridoxal phosphate enzyme (YggS family)